MWIIHVLQNRRPDYLTTFMNELVSWDAVAKRLQAALSESWSGSYYQIENYDTGDGVIGRSANT